MSVLEDFSKRVSSVAISVVGDVMLDHYVIGEATRISPEAPVPIIQGARQEFKIGGAGNVLQNLVALHIPTNFLTCIGRDSNGTHLRDLISKIADPTGVVVDPTASTIIKTRVIARKQQVVRVDWDLPEGFEYSSQVLEEFQEKALATFKSVGVLVLSDYGKGLFQTKILRNLIEKSREFHVPSLVDPKCEDFRVYRGCYGITPNAQEASRATRVEVRDNASAELAARKIHELTQAEFVCLTRGQDGMTLYIAREDQTVHLAALAKEVYDVSGAGDTVIAFLAAGKALGLSEIDMGRIANAAASVVVGKFGAASCNLDELRMAWKEEA